MADLFVQQRTAAYQMYMIHPGNQSRVHQNHGTRTTACVNDPDVPTDLTAAGTRRFLTGK